MALRHPLARLGLAALVATGATPALAQPPAGDTVTWTASAAAESVKPGGRAVVTLHGVVRPGWHVYGFDQKPTGPTPLKVALDPSEVATTDGAPKGSPPVLQRDAAFGFDTQFYAADFTVTAPLRIGAHAPAGRQQILLSVRFQTCNGTICHPPKTVRLSAPVTVRGEG